MKTRVRPAVRPDLVWLHDGRRCRATVWPDVRFETELIPGEWTECDPAEEALASAAASLHGQAWQRYLEFVPAAERSFIQQFRYGRMAALLVVVRCPSLLPALQEAPGLTAYLTAHVSLRGGDAPGWGEINAVHEREGIFGVLQWLGLPASPQTLEVFAQIADPDLPRRLLEPLRAALWEPETMWALRHADRLTDRRLAAACHALAA